MSEELERLGISKVGVNNRICIIKEVASLMNIKKGDVVGFYKSDDGEIILRKIA